MPGPFLFLTRLPVSSFFSALTNHFGPPSLPFSFVCRLCLDPLLRSFLIFSSGRLRGESASSSFSFLFQGRVVIPFHRFFYNRYRTSRGRRETSPFPKISPSFAPVNPLLLRPGLGALSRRDPANHENLFFFPWLKGFLFSPATA